MSDMVKTTDFTFVPTEQLAALRAELAELRAWRDTAPRAALRRLAEGGRNDPLDPDDKNDIDNWVRAFLAQE